jgi:carbonic anhydrase
MIATQGRFAVSLSALLPTLTGGSGSDQEAASPSAPTGSPFPTSFDFGQPVPLPSPSRTEGTSARSQREAQVRARTVPSWAGFVSTFVLLTACGGNGDQVRRSPEPSDPVSSSQEVHWSYSGEGGPDTWGELSPEFGVCGTGNQQSPIDLSEAQPADVPDIEFLYKMAAFQVVNTGHTVQANAADAGGITVDGQRYELVQFHAHGPSEHTVQGRPAALEIHLVHESSDGKLAVVGILLHEGGANDALARAWSRLPERDETAAIGSFDATTLLPGNRLTYRYDGSLTTPPCTEGVRWLVLEHVGSVDATTVDAFSNLVGPNSRPVQPRHQRGLLLDNSPD